MNTPALPPNHELLPSDFLRQHGAVKDLRYHNPAESDIEWSYWNNHDIPERAYRSCVFCAPLGTIAAATTRVPEGRCECGKLAGHEGLTFLGGSHMDVCPAHPRNAYVHILPHQLAQLPEKPQGLISRRRADKFPEDTWRESMRVWPNNRPFHSDYVYAVPRHVLDRIEQQLSTKGGELCPNSTTTTTASSQPTAPESSDPTGEAAPSVDEVINFIAKLIKNGGGIADPFGGKGWQIYDYQGPADKHASILGEGPTLRAAIISAMESTK